MKAELTLKLGDKMLKLSDEGNETVIMKALGFWSQLPEVCSCCKGNNLSLFARATKDGDDYYGIKCQSCGSDFTFHQYKKGGFYTTPDDVFKKYVAGTAIEDKTAKKQQINSNDDSDGNIPF